MRIGPSALSALLVLPLAVTAQGSAALSRGDEIRLARSAAPPAVARDARVYVLDHGRYVVADSGRSGLACVVIRIPAEGLEPECGDAEADTTVLAVERFRTEQGLAGHTRADVERAVKEGLADGRLRAPARPAMVYMMSSAQILYNGDKRIGKWMPHVMMFYPNLRDHDLGLPVGDPDIRTPGVINPGTPLSALIVVTTGFVDPAPTP
jgi:hypothetical protein